MMNHTCDNMCKILSGNPVECNKKQNKYTIKLTYDDRHYTYSVTANTSLEAVCLVYTDEISDYKIQNRTPFQSHGYSIQDGVNYRTEFLCRASSLQSLKGHLIYHMVAGILYTIEKLEKGHGIDVPWFYSELNKYIDDIPYPPHATCLYDLISIRYF